MVVGFEAVKSSILEQFSSNRLHHALLLHGQKGIGKASFAKALVKEILDIKNAFHPDLLLVEKELEKKEITVDKIRKISVFTNQTSAISPHRFIIIDSACELNRSAGNALLKILEEPNRNIFLILISHNLSRILPTIKSRCQIIKIPNLSLKNFAEILRAKNPRISVSDLQFLSEISNNSAADAINFGSDLARFYELFLRSILNKRIGEELLKKISDKNFSFVIFEKIFEFFIGRLCKFSTKGEVAFFFDEAEVFLNLTQKLPVKKIFVIADEALNLLRKTSPMNLDKKLSFINIFNLITHD